MRWGVPASLLVVLTVLLAGCTATEGEPSASGSPSASLPPPAETPVADEATGSITGTVADPEGLPVSAVTVSVVETLASTTSDTAGAFTFNGVEPGAYRLVFERVGFKTAAKQVQVIAGEVAEVAATMEPTVVLVEPYHESTPFSAHIHLGWVFFQDVTDTLNQSATNGLTCDPCQFVFPIEKNPTQGFTETVWTASGNAAMNQDVWLYVKRNWTTGNYGDGTSVVATYFSNREQLNWTSDAVAGIRDNQVEWLLTEVYGGFAGLNVDHKLDIWNTLSYNGYLPNGFTALPPQ